MKAILIFVLLSLSLVVKSFFGNLVAFFYMFMIFSLPVFFDIAKSSFKNGKLDKVIFSILTLCCSPLGYMILSYGHKTNLTNKQRENLSLIEKYSIYFLIFLFVVVGFLVVIQPEVYGNVFLGLSGITILGVIFFHGLYPQHWELYEQQKGSVQGNSSIFLLSKN